MPIITWSSCDNTSQPNKTYLTLNHIFKYSYIWVQIYKKNTKSSVIIFYYYLEIPIDNYLIIFFMSINMFFSILIIKNMIETRLSGLEASYKKIAKTSISHCLRKLNTSNDVRLTKNVLKSISKCDYISTNETQNKMTLMTVAQRWRRLAGLASLP